MVVRGRWFVLVLRFALVRAPPETGEHIVKLVAIDAEDGLHGAVQARFGAAGNTRLVMTMRTIEMKRPAHVLEIQFLGLTGNTGK